MTLSAALLHLEHLRRLQQQTAHRDAWKSFSAHVTAATQGSMHQHVPKAADLPHDLARVDAALGALHDRLASCELELIDQCASLVPQYERMSEEIYRAETVRTLKVMADSTRSIDSFWTVKTAATQEELDMIRGRLDAFNDWRVPGLMIRPGIDDWIDRLVALDPLYLVDQSLVLLRPALQRFPKLYQQRLRQYAIDETHDRIMIKLPQAQIGVVFCYDFFCTRPLRIIQKYMESVWDLLRPGGVFLFTYSDGDRTKAAELVERGVNCYTPAHRVRELWSQQGFETVFEYESDLGWNYAEVRRPGVIKTLRGGQSLAKIRPII